jgi:hypothetical protein
MDKHSSLSNEDKGVDMDELKLTGGNLGPVFNSRCGHACFAVQLHSEQKQSAYKLKTRPKQFLGWLQLALAIPT